MANPQINPEYLAKVEARLATLRQVLASLFPDGIAEFTWEVGCGHGHFLTKLASVRPDRFHVGIDILGDRLRRAEKKLKTAGVGNLRFVKAEAMEFLECLPSNVSLSDVVILFPDPWPKKRHHKNRLIQREFLDRLAARMTEHGRLYFRTDHAPYLQWASDIFTAHPAWTLVSDAPWVLEEKTVFQAKASSFGSLVADVRTRRSPRRPTE